MAQLDPATIENLVPIVVVPVVFGSILLVTNMIMRFKLKKKELEVREKELEMRGSNAELGPVVDELRDDLDDTRAQLAEMQERLDFAERLLTAGRASEDEKGK